MKCLKFFSFIFTAGCIQTVHTQKGFNGSITKINSAHDLFLLVPFPRLLRNANVAIALSINEIGLANIVFGGPIQTTGTTQCASMTSFCLVM